MPPSGKSHSSHSSSHHSSHSSHRSGGYHKSSSSYGRSYYGGDGGYYGRGNGGGRGCGCLGALLGPFVIIIVVMYLVISGKFGDKDKIREVISDVSERAPRTETTTYDTGTPAEDLYVEAIGRTCEWDPEEEWYFDQATDCYFWYNNEIDPPQWQYWYEGISSEYGDYGWMEYGDDGRWYIERSENSWIELPERFDTSNLWHIDD